MHRAARRTGTATALLLVRHAAIDRAEVAEVLHRRWPSSVVGDVGAEPSWSMSAQDAAELAHTRRGVEPLRIVVLAQRTANTGERRCANEHDLPEAYAPMPIAF